MQIIVAKNAGFCFGVKRALEYAERAALSYGSVCSLGPLIHNPQEVARLKQKGINWVESLDQVEGHHVIIRSHGVSPQIIEEAQRIHLDIIDATCPFVKRAQKHAKDLAERGYQVVVVGDKNHPEVEGIVGWSGNTAIVVETEEETKSLSISGKIGLIAQTTQTASNFRKIEEVLREKTDDLTVYNTICNATSERQEAADKLAHEVDLIFVIGGLNSANSMKLARICRETGTPTYHIEEADDIDISLLAGVKKAGITAGASTPDWIIEEVIQKMMENTQNGDEQKMEEVVQESASAETANLETQAVDAGSDVEADASFAEEFHRGIKEVRRGERVLGTVVQVRDNEVLVDVGGKSEGVVPRSELSLYEAENIREAIKVGDEIEVLVLKRENQEGHPILSKKRVDQEKNWDILYPALESGAPVTGKVVDVVKGGLLVDTGVRGFVPASLVDLGYVEDLKAYLGKELTMKVIECDRANNKLILSAKAILEADYKKKREAAWANLAEGQTVSGTVRRLTSFGAFVDIGGIDGLLHVSEMAWYRVSHPSDLLKEGDQIQVYVLSIDRDKEKVSLGLKQLMPNPWSVAGEKYPVGTIVKGKVVRTASFGAFVQIEPGVEGLVHISHISEQRVAKTEDVLKPGDEVTAKVLSIDLDAKRISLSIKEALTENAADEEIAPDTDASVEAADEETVLEVSIGEMINKSDEE